MHRKSSLFVIPAGASALLVIFAVLCLTTLAMLSLATVQANRRTADASAEAVEEYYTADTQAEEILAQLRCGKIPEGVKGSGCVYTYSVSISNTQKLYVKVRIKKDQYTVLQWQAISTANWKPDDSLHVWNGQINQ